MKQLSEPVPHRRDGIKEFLEMQVFVLGRDAKFQRSLEDKKGKHSKYMPYVFTEQGVAMLSAVLRSFNDFRCVTKPLKRLLCFDKFCLPAPRRIETVGYVPKYA